MVNRSPAQLLSLVPGLGERAKVSRPSCPLISTHLFLHFRSVLLLCCPGFPRSCHPFPWLSDAMPTNLRIQSEQALPFSIFR